MSVASYVGELEGLADQGNYAEIMRRRQADVEAVWSANQRIAAADLFVKDILARDGYARTRVVSSMNAFFRRESRTGAANFTHQ